VNGEWGKTKKCMQGRMIMTEKKKSCKEEVKKKILAE